MIRYDRPSNAKHGDVCICYRSNIPLGFTNIGYLHEWLSFELQIGDKICNFVAFYRSPSQSQDDFKTFADNFEKALEILAQKKLFVNLQTGIIKTKQVSKVPPLAM